MTVFCARPARPGGWRQKLDVSPGEFIGLVVTALAWNAFAYGAVLRVQGPPNWLTLALLAAGGLIGLGSASWLVVVYHVRTVISS